MTWLTAPDTEIRFTVSTPSFRTETEEDIRPDGQDRYRGEAGFAIKFVVVSDVFFPSYS